MRKIRVKSSGRRIRGGARSIYYCLSVKNQIYMLLIYTKKSQDNLTPKQLKLLRQIVDMEK